VLWRGITSQGFGSAVYAKPEFVSNQPLTDFFAAASRPDNKALQGLSPVFARNLAGACGFTSARARTQLLRQVVDMMLAPEDPYDALELGTAAPTATVASRHLTDFCRDSSFFDPNCAKPMIITSKYIGEFRGRVRIGRGDRAVKIRTFGGRVPSHYWRAMAVVSSCWSSAGWSEQTSNLCRIGPKAR